MLEELTIAGLGVLENASAEFDPGFTVLTGETGAGKTMVVTSLHLLSGGRADASRVRTGHEKAVVEGRFRLDGAAGPAVGEILESAGAQADDASLIAIRTVGSDGRSRAHLGGRSVPVGVLGQVTSSMLTIHGQNDQLRLLRGDQQRAALDRFGGPDLAAALETYRTARARWVRLADELEQRRASSFELAQEADRLRFAVQELEAVSPEPGEDVALTATIKRLSDLERVRSAGVQAHALATGDADAVGDTGQGVITELGQIRTLLETSGDAALEALLPRVGEALAIVTDLASELSGIVAGLPADAAELDQLLVRQSELKALTRKYAPDVDGVREWWEQARTRLAEIDDPSESLEELTESVAAAAEEVGVAAAALRALRVDAAAKLADRVTEELGGLAMGDAALRVTVTPDLTEGVPEAEAAATTVTAVTPAGRRVLPVDGQRCRVGGDGADLVEFALVPHRDAVPMPIAKSASGGELSRVMLALEVVLASPEGGSVMVFDEVDAGVGGRAAVEIGRRLARLARNHQVIVVTHLPQVAAFADHHVVIGKDDGGATSSVRTLTGDERVGELARMLAGLGDTDTGRAHAEELLSTAQAERVG
ncbi:DNA repair protein RecN [Gordonia sp. X0973]|uniref:DNA repair protein RecN n=1 Tax=Gordonia sp. X0973 TaxID=2742602 RepID=UPI000F543653|nr:DNA repair protein RecN [Gordonia sp. X0973]QKT07162.1 DNA repair protein RecN [Gordonia sp. X0973]